MWWTVIVGAILLGSLAAVGLRLTVSAAARAIERRHRQIEEILRTRRPLAGWVPPQFSAGAAPSSTPGTRAQRRARRRCVYRLNRLLSYVEHSQMIAADGTKTALQRELEEIRNEWQTAELCSLFQPAVPEAAGAGAAPVRKARPEND